MCFLKNRNEKTAPTLFTHIIQKFELKESFHTGIGRLFDTFDCYQNGISHTLTWELSFISSSLSASESKKFSYNSKSIEMNVKKIEEIKKRTQ